MLRIDGEVELPQTFSFGDLAEIDASFQIADMSTIDATRKGGAVQLEGLLQRVSVLTTATYIGLHASTDDFHASIPLAAIREKSFLIYELDGKPLELSAGGPARFYIVDHAACHTEEIDECANVKFVDHIELTAGKGFDNRPEDDEEHAQLHRDEKIE